MTFFSVKLKIYQNLKKFWQYFFHNPLLIWFQQCAVVLPRPRYLTTTKTPVNYQTTKSAVKLKEEGIQFKKNSVKMKQFISKWRKLTICKIKMTYRSYLLPKLQDLKGKQGMAEVSNLVHCQIFPTFTFIPRTI